MDIQRPASVAQQKRRKRILIGVAAVTIVVAFAVFAAASLLTMPIAKTPAWAWFTDLVVR